MNCHGKKKIDKSRINFTNRPPNYSFFFKNKYLMIQRSPRSTFICKINGSVNVT